ncbi:thrombospondin-1-like [Clytia hemisphaerica]
MRYFQCSLDCGNGSKLYREGCFTVNGNAKKQFVMRSPIYQVGSVTKLVCDCAAKAKGKAIFLTNYEECYETKIGSSAVQGGQATDDKCINSYYTSCQNGQDCIGVAGYVFAYKVPVDGGWSSWSTSGPCSRPCGPGRRRSTRKCLNPEPKYGGKQCVGSSVRYSHCNNGACIPDFRNKGKDCWNKPAYFCGKKGVCSRAKWTGSQDAAFPCWYKHCCTEPALVKNIGTDCWSQCGGKGGYCSGFCGVNGRCCRKGWNDAGCAGMAKPCNGHHCCTTRRQDVQNYGKECYTKCNRIDGECPTGFCGKDGVCCRHSWDAYKCYRSKGPCHGYHCCVATKSLGIQN